MVEAELPKPRRMPVFEAMPKTEEIRDRLSSFTINTSEEAKRVLELAYNSGMKKELSNKELGRTIEQLLNGQAKITSVKIALETNQATAR